MHSGHPHGSRAGVQSCSARPLSSYPVKQPTHTTCCMKNFSNKVNFNEEEKLPCKNTWYCDVHSNHVRNKHLLDSPHKTPKCCKEVHDMVKDRQKQKKLRKNGLSRPVRTWNSNLEVEEKNTCKSEANMNETEEEGETEETGEAEETEETGEGKPSKKKKGAAKKEVEDLTIFPECFIPSDSESEDEEDERQPSKPTRSLQQQKSSGSGSGSECSGCSTRGGGKKKKKQEVVKKSWKDLLHTPGVELCRESVAEELRKHKLGHDLALKLKRFFN